MSNNAYHFDVYSDFSPLLLGVKYPFPLRADMLEKIENKSEIEIASFKSSSRVDANVLSELPNLKLLITRTVGTDHVDLDACRAAGVEVKNIRDYGAFSVAEHVFALLLSLTRRVIAMNDQVKSGVFDSRNAKGFSLEGKVMGVVGSGRIGIEVIKLAKAFKMQVVVYDMYENQMLSNKIGFKYVALNELLEKSDVISLSVPLTDDTRHLIGADQIKQMKDQVILVNTSRGAVIGTDALVASIDKFMYVGLDVLEDEGKFDLNHPLLKFDHVVITPHCAFYTDQSVKRIGEKTMELVSEYR